MKKIFKSEWNKSYDHFDNHIFYPKEEVVKFLNRFVRKKISDNLFKDILIKEKGNITGLDYGCGIGRMTMLMKEFNIDSYGLDISESAIKKAKNLFPDMKEKFKVTDGENIPFPNQDFDIVICESVIDSMGFEIAKKVVSEFDRITKKYLFISFISGNNHNHHLEYNGEDVISNEHEKGTVQSWYNWTKIIKLFNETNFKIKWARLITEESLIDKYKNSRYYIVFEK